MIVSYEVGAIFDIEDRASGTIARIAEAAQTLVAAAKEAKDAIASIGASSPLAGINRAVNNLRDNLTRAAGSAKDAETIISALFLLCHKFALLGYPLTTRAARKSANDVAGDGDTNRSDRVRHVTFRSDWESRGVDNLRIGEVLR